jgi:ABC-2 type transport system ATP-binding protein
MITLETITKNYGKTTALSGVNLKIDGGKITCLVGPNGSGKSTLIKLVLGLTRPTSGTVLIDNMTTLGYLTEMNSLPAGYKGSDILSKLETLTNTRRSESVKKLIHLFDIESFIHQKIKSYSKGMQKKIALLVAFTGDPDIVILDEPFEGIDTIDRDKLAEFIKEYTFSGKSIIMSTHILYELDDLCDIAHFLKKGQVIASYEPKKQHSLFNNHNSTEFIVPKSHIHDEIVVTNPTITEIYRKIYQ